MNTKFTTLQCRSYDKKWKETHFIYWKYHKFYNSKIYLQAFLKSLSICLPNDPQDGHTFHGTLNYLYGAEYDVVTFGEHQNGDDVPCAVCRSNVGIQTVMIPARLDCYNGWTKQYAGYLGTERHVHSSGKDYICVDQDSQASPAGRHEHNGAHIYPVSYQCGSLNCPPYKHGHTATCVVCSL